MTFTIGRAAFTNAPTTSDHDGDRVQFNIDILPTTLVEAKVLRQQVLGLADNPYEPVVPVIWTDDDDYTGFYRVLGARCEPTSAWLYNKLMRAQIDVERVKAYGLPMQEVSTSAILRTNGHGITVPDSIVIVTDPTSQTLQMDATLQPLWAAMAAGVSLRSTTDGNVNVYRTPAPMALSTYIVDQWPLYCYYGAALIEQQISGIWYKVIGAQLPYNTKWRISNGIVRFTSHAVNGTAATLEVWTGAAWESLNVVHWEAGTNSVPAGYLAATVIRNSVDKVVVRAQAAAVSGGGYVVCDYSVTRGHMHIEASWAATLDWTQKLGAGFSTAVASTDIGGAIVATAADANGNKLVFGVAAADSVDLVNGRVWPASDAASGSMFMGVSLNAAAGGTDSPAELLDQFQGISMVDRVVAAR